MFANLNYKYKDLKKAKNTNTFNKKQRKEYFFKICRKNSKLHKKTPFIVYRDNKITKYERSFFMAKILLYNNNANRMEIYYKGVREAMPYNSNRTLTVGEFQGSSNSNIIWTDLRTMQSWNSLRYLYGAPIYVGFAFKRPWQGGHSNLSQHYARGSI